MISVACGWCDNTHIADVTCTCKAPCPRGWCPALNAAERALAAATPTLRTSP